MAATAFLHDRRQSSVAAVRDRRDSLQSVQDWWYLVIPATGIAVGLLVGVLGALVGGLLAVAYNKSPGQAQVVVEIPSLE